MRKKMVSWLMFFMAALYFLAGDFAHNAFRSDQEATSQAEGDRVTHGGGNISARMVSACPMSKAPRKAPGMLPMPPPRQPQSFQTWRNTHRDYTWGSAWRIDTGSAANADTSANVKEITRLNAHQSCSWFVVGNRAHGFANFGAL